jgi:hypothetical protein
MVIRGEEKSDGRRAHVQPGKMQNWALEFIERQRSIRKT